MDDSKERAAYHEAAHAVVAAAQGFLPVCVRIKRSKGDAGWEEWVGATEFPPQMTARSIQQRVAVAGFLAEAKWQATRRFPTALLNEATVMESFLKQVRSWQRCRITARVPIIANDQRFDEEVLVFDSDLSFLNPNDDVGLISALRCVRRKLNHPKCWSAVVGLAQRLLDAKPNEAGLCEVIEIAQRDVDGLIRRSVA